MAVAKVQGSTLVKKQYSLEEIKEIGEALGLVQKHNPASAVPGGGALHGFVPGSTTQFGLFADPGVRPDMFSAITRPASLAKLLTPTASEFVEEILDIMTGQSAGSGETPDDYCGDPPVAGDLYKCQQRFQFGNYFIKTQLKEIPRIGELRNRADVMRNVLNQPPALNPLIPDLFYRMTDTRSVLQYELFKIGNEFSRTLEQTLVLGATAAAAGDYRGWMSQFKGLDGQIKTGFVDPDGVECSALDSVVITFGADIADTIADGDGRDFQSAISDLWYAVNERAQAAGLDGVEWAFVMRREAFRAVTYELACTYAVNRCSTADGSINRQMVDNTRSLFDEMTRGRFLRIDAVDVPVVFSEGIPQTTESAFNFSSDIYLVPLSWNGMPLLHLDFFDMNNRYLQEWNDFVDAEATVVMNNGLFLAGRRDTGFCKEYIFASRLRLILETPFLAGRIDGVSYQFRADITNAIPGESFYPDSLGVSYTS